MDGASADGGSSRTRPPGRGDAALAAVSRVPPLALLAVGAALFELVLARAVWHGLNDVLAANDIVELRRLARFPRNLSAVAGLGALLVALFAFLRLPGFASIGRRLVVAAFAGVFVPSIVVAAVLPAAMVQPKLVVFGLAAANVLVTLLALTAARYRPEPALRVAVALASATAFATLLVVGLGQLARAEGGFWQAVGAVLVENPSGAERLLLGIRHLGELAWMGVLATGCAAAAWDRGETGARVRVAVTVALVVACAGGLLVVQDVSGHRFRYLLFGSFRLGLFVDDVPAVYALPLGLGLAGAFSALARPSPAMQQLGAGLLAWLCAGFAPHTPIQLLYLVLGAALLSRAAQARDPDGAWRTHQPWARWTSGAAPPRSRPSPELDPEVERETFDDRTARRSPTDYS